MAGVRKQISRFASIRMLMKKFLIVGNFLLFSLFLHAQNEYFLFIQSENNQPYYVQTKGRTLSSSAIGHLIISGLKDSIYVLHIGFPKNQFPEQIFQVRINKRDAGYQLKNMGLEGWALFNMQTLQLIKAQAVELKKQTVFYGDIKKTDNFSTLMAGVVNDSAVLYSSIVRAESGNESSKTNIPDSPIVKADVSKQEEILKMDTAVRKQEISKQEEVVKTVKKDAPSGSNTGLPQVPARPNEQQVIDSVSATQSMPVEVKPKQLKPLIVWYSETKTNAGTELVFFDMSPVEKIDTIRILILKEDINTKGIDEDINKRQPANDTNSPENKEDQKSSAGKLIGKIFGKKNNATQPKTDSVKNTSSVKVTTIDNGRTTAPAQAPSTDPPPKPVLTNSDCRQFASEYDVDKLRVRMLGEKDADGQVTEARKLFRVKCFSTKQIKALSELFRTDEGRYKLFDAAYPFVSDTSNFKDLAALLSEEYYINRFKAMVRM